MKTRLIALVILAVFAAAVPAMAARQAVNPIVHGEQFVFQAYSGSSVGNLCFRGFGLLGPNTITSVPGILCIIPQDGSEPPWANFVSAFQANVNYTIKNVVLTKVVPPTIQCTDRYFPRTVAQQGTPNIRRWWPLMYEVPGTTWTLVITYGTPSWADPANPNFPSTVHQDIWTWRLDANLASLSFLLELFHELPFGLDEVPLVSDEELYPILQRKITDISTLFVAGNLAAAGNLLADFELEVADACITVSPPFPFPTGDGTGIANTFENPACCKLLIDAEYIGFQTGIFQPNK